MSTFWSFWIIVLLLLTLGGSVWLLFVNRKIKIKADLPEGEVPTTGHAYDGIEEYDNPLPSWWFWLFVATLLFSILYLILYPGFGGFAGVLGWTSENQWQNEMTQAEEKYGPIYQRLAEQSVEDLSANPEALKIGRRLFNNNCAVCHGSDGRGAPGYPNLTDDDWLFGGNPADIKFSITNGRIGAMPAWGTVVGEEGVVQLGNYVLSLSGSSSAGDDLAEGEKLFKTYCVACHGMDARGIATLGAPDLTDEIWLFGGRVEDIRHSIRSGRSGRMPAQKEQLKAEKIHLLAAYVFGLSKNN